MKPTAAKVVISVGLVLVFVLTSDLLRAQDANVTLSGTVTDTSGKVVANAKVSVTNVATGQAMETQTNSTGLYNVLNLTPADYEVSVTAEGFDPKVAKVTLTVGASQTMDVALNATPPQHIPENQPTAPQDNLPNAPSSSKTAPSLEDLGFPAEQSQGDAKQQALLDKRTHMLKIHQRLGLITTNPLIVTVANLPQRRGQEHQHRLARSAYGSWRAYGRLVFPDRVLCHPRAQGAGNRNSRAPFACTKPWPGFMARE